jgi:anti-anti-sigma factor
MVDTEKVTAFSHDGVETVCGAGELDLYVVDKFKEALSKASETGNRIQVDFRQASFIDTAFVVALVAPAKKMLERGGRLKVLVVKGAYPQYVLRVVGFAEIMDVVAEEGVEPTEG